MKYSILAVLTILLAGCTVAMQPETPPRNFSPLAIKDQVAAESDELHTTQKVLKDALEHSQAPAHNDLQPIMPTYDPLEDQIISFSMVDEDIEVILYSLSKAVGMNLIIDPAVTADSHRLTMNFEKVPAATVLREILVIYDLCYEVEENVIRVKPFTERIFSLNFLDTKVSTNFDLGGDVLGAGGMENAGGLSGSFRLTGQGGTQNNAYDVVEEMIQRVLSGKGKYSLNRISGSLYVMDTPAVVRTVARLINHLKQMLAKQILIEARIIEVALSDEYRYGIDWNIVKDLSNASTELTGAAWSSFTGLLMQGTSGDYSIGTTIEALNTFGDAKVVSNPTLRSKHGNPAMISVGTSISYKKSIKVTEEESSTQTRERTEVEVSTVFDGLILGVVPFIETNGKISLMINPIKSDVDRASLEPEAIGENNIEGISLPEVSIKEISTTITMNSGDVVILGGLIDKRTAKKLAEVPIVSSIPVLGYLFREDLEIEQTRELVIILNVLLV